MRNSQRQVAGSQWQSVSSQRQVAGSQWQSVSSQRHVAGSQSVTRQSATAGC